MKKSYIGILVIALCLTAFFIGQNLSNNEPQKTVQNDPKQSGKVSAVAKSAKKSTRKSTLIKTKDEDLVADSRLIREITAQGENTDYASLGYKAANIKKLNLSKNDFKSLCDYLKASAPKDGNYLGIHSLKNEMLVAMIENGSFIEELGNVFTDILADSEQHPVMREYISQFIPEYFEKRWKGKDVYEEQEEILKPLYMLLDNNDDSLAGTSLSTLSILAEKYPAVDGSLLKRKAFKMAEDSALTQASRMQAFRYINQFSEGRVILEDFSFNNSNPVMLRMIALRSLSEKVEDTARERIFKRISNEILNEKNEDKRLLTAAKAARKILDTQIQGKE